MKKLLEGLGLLLGILIGIPIFFLVCIGYLLYVPFDILKYHKMPYYRDLKHKYKFLITKQDTVKFYNYAAKQNLQIAYFQNDEMEYFIKENEVILCSWSSYELENADGQWYLLPDKDSEIKISVEESLQEEKMHLKPEHRDLPAKYLIFCEEQNTEALQCPWCYCIFEN